MKKLLLFISLFSLTINAIPGVQLLKNVQPFIKPSAKLIAGSAVAGLHTLILASDIYRINQERIQQKIEADKESKISPLRRNIDGCATCCLFHDKAQELRFQFDKNGDRINNDVKIKCFNCCGFVVHCNPQVLLWMSGIWAGGYLAKSGIADIKALMKK